MSSVIDAAAACKEQKQSDKGFNVTRKRKRVYESSGCDGRESNLESPVCGDCSYGGSGLDDGKYEEMKKKTSTEAGRQFEICNGDVYAEVVSTLTGSRKSGSRKSVFYPKKCPYTKKCLVDNKYGTAVIFGDCNQKITASGIICNVMHAGHIEELCEMRVYEGVIGKNRMLLGCPCQNCNGTCEKGSIVESVFYAALRDVWCNSCYCDTHFLMVFMCDPNHAECDLADIKITDENGMGPIFGKFVQSGRVIKRKLSL